MYTFTRLSAALLLAALLATLAPFYDRLYDPDHHLRWIVPYFAAVGAAVGWTFLGGRQRAVLWSIYFALQALVLAGLGTAVLAAVRDIFVLGFRRRFREPLEAVLAIPDLVVTYLAAALDLRFLALAVAGGIAVGACTFWLDRWFERLQRGR